MPYTSVRHPARAALRPAVPRDWGRIGRWLVTATLAYNVAEGVIALWAGAHSGSVALMGFGLDSAMECAAAATVWWLLTVESRGAPPYALARREQRVHRFVGATFVGLVLYVLGQAGWTLWSREAPGESLPGILLATVSLVVMPLVSWGKLQAAQALHSAALRSEAKEMLACAYLSFTLVLGLLANTVAGCMCR